MSILPMKHLLLTTIAAVVLVGYAQSQQSGEQAITVKRDMKN